MDVLLFLFLSNLPAHGSMGSDGWSVGKKNSMLSLISFETGGRTPSQSSGQPEGLRQPMEVRFF
jgi:hypothetical protein